jgi:hypothetical protein
MPDFSLVKDKAQNMCGLWVSNPADARDRVYLCTLLLRSGAADNLSQAVMTGEYRVEPNTVDGKGGCFVMFGMGSSEKKKSWWKRW